jgi:hypothetical protein
MRHRGTRLRAVVAALLLALGAMFTAVVVASLSSSTSDSSAVTSTRTHEGAETRHEALSVRTTAVSSRAGIHVAGPHLDLVAAVAALAAVLLLLGWLGTGRSRRLLPRLVTAPLGARAPPALV